MSHSILTAVASKLRRARGVQVDEPAWEDDDAAALAAVHASLADEISRLAQPPRLERPVGAVLLNPLQPRERRRLARLSLYS